MLQLLPRAGNRAGVRLLRWKADSRETHVQYNSLYLLCSREALALN